MLCAFLTTKDQIVTAHRVRVKNGCDFLNILEEDENQQHHISFDNLTKSVKFHAKNINDDYTTSPVINDNTINHVEYKNNKNLALSKQNGITPTNGYKNDVNGNHQHPQNGYHNGHQNNYYDIITSMNSVSLISTNDIVPPLINGNISNYDCAKITSK